jgi:hypothetical protein
MAPRNLLIRRAESTAEDPIYTVHALRTRTPRWSESTAAPPAVAPPHAAATKTGVRGPGAWRRRGWRSGRAFTWARAADRSSRDWTATCSTSQISFLPCRLGPAARAREPPGGHVCLKPSRGTWPRHPAVPGMAWHRLASDRLRRDRSPD